MHVVQAGCVFLHHTQCSWDKLQVHHDCDWDTYTLKGFHYQASIGLFLLKDTINYLRKVSEMYSSKINLESKNHYPSE